MKCVIVTGMSGAGKASAMKMLEDMGYFCIDNMQLCLYTINKGGCSDEKSS